MSNQFCDRLLETLTRHRLFDGMQRSDVAGIIDCCGGRMQQYLRGEALLSEGDRMGDIGLIVSGAAQAVKTDHSGRQLVISQLGAGDIFGAILAAGHAAASPVTVKAAEDTRALLLPYARVLHRCAKICPRHDLLLRNLLVTISEKYFELHDRINCIIRPTLRDKILFYLETTAQKMGSRTFNIPFDRSAMADFLNAERSALSRELSAMRQEGLIDYYKNTFRLI